MSKTNGDGLPQIQDGEGFHEWMQRCYQQQQTPGAWARDKNCNHVQSRLPGSMYRQFYALLKAKGWSQTTGLQYAVHLLLINEQNHA